VTDVRTPECPCGDGPRPGHPGGFCDEGLQRLITVSGGRLSMAPPPVDLVAVTEVRVPLAPPPGIDVLKALHRDVQYHGVHSEDEHERDLADARSQALNSITALRDVKNERDKAEAEVERLRKVNAEHADENLRLHGEVEKLRALRDKTHAEKAVLDECEGFTDLQVRRGIEVGEPNSVWTRLLRAVALMRGLQ
jgi:hypothetical protein